jgi:hypothetical protein
MDVGRTLLAKCARARQAFFTFFKRIFQGSGLWIARRADYTDFSRKEGVCFHPAVAADFGVRARFNATVTVSAQALDGAGPMAQTSAWLSNSG